MLIMEKTKTAVINKRYLRSIELLNLAVANEIATSLQYTYFHVHCEDRGYRPFARYFKQTAIREMVHIERLSERILFLGGDVNMNSEFRTKQINTPVEMLRLAAQLETQTINNYNTWSKETGMLEDAATHTLFQDLVKEEEAHLDNFRTEAENMETYGDNYLALQSIVNIKELAEETVEMEA